MNATYVNNRNSWRVTEKNYYEIHASAVREITMKPARESSLIVPARKRFRGGPI